MSRTPDHRGRGRAASVLRDFLEHEAAGGIVLMISAVIALVWANSYAAPAYFGTLETHFGFALGPLDLDKSVLHWINDGLMALFFLLVGLEIKRELLDGQLSTWRRRALPGIAAAGGMVAPGVIYVAFNLNDPDSLRGWAIPTATDIAFALGVLALLGSRVPASLKVFLTALAILDDLGAVVIIALFYTADLNLPALGGAAAVLAGLILLNVFRVARLTPYILLGLVLWIFVLKSGIHATLAGVALALTIPLNVTPGRPDDPHSPLHRLEHSLLRPVAFLVLPLFGLANAGVAIPATGLSALTGTLPLGIASGLFVGKQIGVFGSAALAIRLGLAEAPALAGRAQIWGVSVLCGIGFTMSLFIGALAFGDSQEQIEAAKMGVLTGSFLSALAGYAILSVARCDEPENSEVPSA